MKKFGGPISANFGLARGPLNELSQVYSDRENVVKDGEKPRDEAYAKRIHSGESTKNYLALGGVLTMAEIGCQVTTCRFNTRNHCSLSSVQVGPGHVTVTSPVLEAVASSYDGQLRAGYATEFDAYADYANGHPTHSLPGAVCTTFAPL